MIELFSYFKNNAQEYRHKLVKLLVNQLSCRINQSDSAGNTALHLAVNQNDIESIKLLLIRPDILLLVLNSQSESSFGVVVYKHPSILTVFLSEAENNPWLLQQFRDFTHSSWCNFLHTNVKPLKSFLAKHNSSSVKS